MIDMELSTDAYIKVPPCSFNSQILKSLIHKTEVLKCIFLVEPHTGKIAKKYAHSYLYP